MILSHEPPDLLDRYAEGDAAGLLEIEYTLLLATLQGFTERRSRQRPHPALPTALELLAALAAEMLPDGPAPSLADTLHALDRAYAAWQAEEPPFQRLQARRLAYAHGALSLLSDVT